MWLSNIVHQIALFLVREKILSEKDSQWGEYLIQKSVLSLGVFGVLLIIGRSLAGILESMCFIVNFLYIRRRAGGYHASSPLRCLELSVTVEITSFIVVFVFENKIENMRSIYGILLACSIVYKKKYEFLDNMGMRQAEQRKGIRKEIKSIQMVPLIVGLFLGITYMLCEIKNLNMPVSENISFIKYWGTIVAVYLFAQFLFHNILAYMMVRKIKVKR